MTIEKKQKKPVTVRIRDETSSAKYSGLWCEMSRDKKPSRTCMLRSDDGIRHQQGQAKPLGDSKDIRRLYVKECDLDR